MMSRECCFANEGLIRGISIIRGLLDSIKIRGGSVGEKFEP